MKRSLLASVVALVGIGAALVLAGCSGREDDSPPRGGPLERAGAELDRAIGSLQADLDEAYRHARARVALLQAVGRDALDIDVDVDDVEGQRVVLKGRVTTPEARTRAEEAVRAVENIGTVENEIVYAPPAEGEESILDRAESDVAEMVLHSKVRLALLDELGTDGLGVEIDVDAGRVTLSGTLSESKHAIAREAARRVGGVESVEVRLVGKGA